MWTPQDTTPGSSCCPLPHIQTLIRTSACVSSSLWPTPQNPTGLSPALQPWDLWSGFLLPTPNHLIYVPSQEAIFSFLPRSNLIPHHFPDLSTLLYRVFVLWVCEYSDYKSPQGWAMESTLNRHPRWVTSSRKWLGDRACFGSPCLLLWERRCLQGRQWPQEWIL